MTKVEFLSMSKPLRILYKIGSFFKSIPLGIWGFFKKIPFVILKLLRKMTVPFITLKDALIFGDWKVRLSFLFCGFGEFTRKQVIRGVLVFLMQIVFTLYFSFFGVKMLVNLGDLGYISSATIPISNPPFTRNFYLDNSLLILLYSIVTILFALIMIYLWYNSIKNSYILYKNEQIGKEASDKEYLESYVGKKYQNILLSLPMIGLVLFTVIPMIFMILIGFTNYSSERLTPVKLFDWVGLQTYANLFASKTTNSALIVQSFLHVITWTLIWAFFATFTNYFLGMIVAMLINKKTIKLKKLWRTILVTTIAVPQFVSLLLISRMFDKSYGVVNELLKSLGLITKSIGFLETFPITNIVIICVNIWIGIPYTMLICTGILMNIPEDLYESAKIDGASPFKMYMKITLPYMLFITGPYLISQFVGNINNFNVIYLLSKGGPNFTFRPGITVPTQLTGLGRSDLLITWIYKMTITNNPKDYASGSVMGICVFVIVAFLSLILYNRSNAVKNEEDFQ